MKPYNRRTFLKHSAMATAAAAAGRIFHPSINGQPALNLATVQSVMPQGFDRPFFIQAKNRSEVIAHRGGKGHWPEETMYAFERAVNIGVDVLEMDVHMTSDGELILMHNDSVEGTTNGTGKIKERRWEYLKTLDAGFRWKCGEDLPYKGIGIKIARLEEVFEAFPEMRMNIEIKQSGPSLVPKFCDLIKKHKMQDNVLVASFWDDVMKEFRSRCPGVATSTATLELAEFRIRNRLTGGKFKPKHADVIQMTDKFLLFKLLKQGFVERVHNLRLPIHAWTINTPADMKRMIEAGVDGIITDYPGRLLPLLGRPPGSEIPTLCPIADLKGTEPTLGVRV